MSDDLSLPSESPNIDELQRRILRAIKERDLHEIRSLLEANPKIGTQISSSSQLDILSQAIQKNLPDVLEYLMRSGFQVGRSALFIAIKAEHEQCVEVIVKNVDEGRGDVGPTTIVAGGFVSPLMIAVYQKQYDIIELLVKQGYRLEPDQISLEQTNREVFVLRKIHYYRAKASPLYIAYTYLCDDEASHPLSQIFEITKEMVKKKEEIAEFEEDYEGLSKNLDQFAVDLLNECRTVKEIQDLTYINPKQDIEEKKRKYIEVKSDEERDKELCFLNLAIRRRNVQVSDTDNGLRGRKRPQTRAWEFFAASVTS